ncbi:MAG: electron transport complex subunit E [Corallococcus sp.]|nr:electron transport complex subunit E [Corallococcus sp.]MCM1359880.1 electron transport complex subunit E [Corallococcus sp.]MCM1395314.1 electron transport complex subunit E [Corallococcus sp.]
MKLKRFKEIALDGVARQNPIFRLVLGTCPTLALTTAAMSCLGMGMAVTFVLVCSNLIISLLRNIIPDRVRIPCFIVIIATFVTIVRMFMEAFLPDLYESLGVFLPLIVVNCIILGRAESFASHNPVGESVLDGLFMGIGFTLALTLMGMVRELLGQASLFGVELWDASAFSIKFFSNSAGAFLTYGLFIALFTLCYNAVERKIRHNQAKKAIEANRAASEHDTVAAETAKEAE